MQLLVIHQNAPGQFVHVMQALRGRPNIGFAAIRDAANRGPDLVATVSYSLDETLLGSPPKLARSLSARVVRGELVGRQMLKLRDEGFVPDLVLGHLGWGETLFVRDVWPYTKLVVHAEFYYGEKGGDIGFDPEFDTDDDPTRGFAIRTKNAAILLAVADADYGIAPTKWQGNRFPQVSPRQDRSDA